jgi:hypothetical protein
MTAKNVKTVAETDRRRGGARYALRASRSDVVSLSLTPRSGI